MSPTGYNISPERQQLISSLMTLGAFLSSSSAGIFATKLGRRQCLWLASALCCVSNVVMMTTTSLGGLYAGRLLIGLANGWYMTFSQLYIQVNSPNYTHRLYLLTTLTGMFTCPLPWSPHLRLPNLDLHRHSRGYRNRQRHARNARQELLPYSPCHDLRCSRHHHYWALLHPRITALAHARRQARTGQQINALVAPRPSRSARRTCRNSGCD
jgi:hypothetical protein